MKSISDIIFAVQNCRMDAIGLKKVCAECPYRDDANCIYDLKEDIVAALNTQVPRILTLEEAKSIKTFERVWLDVRLMENVYHLQILQFDDYPAFDTVIGLIRGDWNEYQKGWVLWTDEPTKEQRWAVKWK